jgi:hypothetical protein
MAVKGVTLGSFWVSVGIKRWETEKVGGGGGGGGVGDM